MPIAPAPTLILTACDGRIGTPHTLRPFLAATGGDSGRGAQALRVYPNLRLEPYDEQSSAGSATHAIWPLLAQYYRMIDEEDRTAAG